MSPLWYRSPDLYLDPQLIYVSHLCRRFEGGMESEADCLDRLSAESGQFGHDPLEMLISLEEAEAL